MPSGASISIIASSSSNDNKGDRRDFNGCAPAADDSHLIKVASCKEMIEHFDD